MVVEEDEGEDEDDFMAIVGRKDTDRSAIRTHSNPPNPPTATLHRDAELKSDKERTLEPDSNKPVFVTEEDEMREKEKEKEVERLKSQGSGANQVQ
jgi:hypothetical protein